MNALSPCCQAGRYIEPVFLDTHPGRKTIGEVPACEKCCKAIGTFRSIFATPKDFKPEHWAVMVKFHPRAPFYFLTDGKGRYEPETKTAIAFERQSGADKASGEK